MPTAERKRPWYLVMALLGALALGAYGAANGWFLMMLYREDLDPAQFMRGIVDEADRAAVASRFQTLVAALDAAKGRGWPLGVAMLVVGCAVVVFSMRALGGSPGARAALVQLAVVQGGLDAAQNRALREVELAKVAFSQAEQYAQVHEALYSPIPPSQAASVLAVFLWLRLATGALVVVALTRRRSRAFYEAMSTAVEER
jgi:hypothetical protein